jgi:hypothetical protein
MAGRTDTYTIPCGGSLTIEMEGGDKIVINAQGAGVGGSTPTPSPSGSSVTIPPPEFGGLALRFVTPVVEIGAEEDLEEAVRNAMPGFRTLPSGLPAGSNLLIGVEEGTTGAERADRISEEIAAISGLDEGDIETEVRLFPSAPEERG